MEYSFPVTTYDAMNRARQASRMPSRSSRTTNVSRSGISFEPDSPIGDGESTSGSPRKNPSGLDLLGHTDCFVISGSKVVEGVGSYPVISVGTKSFYGRIMMGSSLSLPCILTL